MPITELETKIVKTVVERFVNLKESSPRKSLITKFRSPEALYRLSNTGILRTFGQTDDKKEYLPSTLAFYYSDNQDIIRIARRSVEIVLHVLQNMFDVELEKVDFTPADVETHARKLYDIVDPESIKLGLYLVRDFGALVGWGTNAKETELINLRIAENIVTITDISREWDAFIKRSTVFDRLPNDHTLREELVAFQPPASTSMPPSTEITPSTHSGLSIFISHSSKDAELALALIDLFKAALALTADKIRCSSVDGYRLPVGVNTEGKLREEVNAARIVVGLITPNSLASYYVMFELGARWGARLFLAPALAGVKASELSGPLSLLNALSVTSEAQLHQLLADIAQQLRLTLQPTASYIRNVMAVKTLADVIVSPSHSKPVQTVTAQKLRMTISAEGEPPSQVLKILANRIVAVSRVDFMLTSDVTITSEDISLEGESVDVRINEGLLTKLWNTPRPDRDAYDHSGPAKIGIAVSCNGREQYYVLPIHMQSVMKNSTMYRKIVGSKIFLENG